MTQLPARRARLTGRGELTPGAYADVVLLDLDELGDRGTFLDPEQPGGVEWVFVNGEPVVRERTLRPDGRARAGAPRTERARRQAMARSAWTLKGGTIVDGSGGARVRRGRRDRGAIGSRRSARPRRAGP